MSIDLNVKINKAISVDNLLDASKKVIKELLGLKDTPPLNAEEMIKGHRQPLASNDFCVGSGMLLIGLENFPDVSTAVVVADLPEVPPWSNSDDRSARKREHH